MKSRKKKREEGERKKRNIGCNILKLSDFSLSFHEWDPKILEENLYNPTTSITLSHLDFCWHA